MTMVFYLNKTDEVNEKKKIMLQLFAETKWINFKQ